MGDTVGKNARLTGAGAGNDHDRTVNDGRRIALNRVELIEQRQIDCSVTCLWERMNYDEIK